MQGTDRAGGSDAAAREFDLPKIIREITRGRAKYKSREVRSSAFLIGAAPDCDLVLGDPRFDPVHSYRFVSPRRVTIRQLGFGPALCVDGRPTSWAALSDLDRLQIGPYKFQVRIEWPGVGAGNSTGGKRERLPFPIDYELATERLLRDVEQYSDAPRLSLFKGDEAYETAERLPCRSLTDRAAWRRPQIRASS